MFCLSKSGAEFLDCTFMAAYGQEDLIPPFATTEFVAMQSRYIFTKAQPSLRVGALCLLVLCPLCSRTQNKATDNGMQSSAQHDQKGRQFLQNGNVPSAEEEFRLSIKDDPSFAAAHLHLGMALLKGGESKSAIEELRAAERLRPNWAEVHLQLGIALRAVKDLVGATAEY